MTWVIRSNVFCSSPLDRLTIGIHGWIHFAAVSSVERTADVGTPTISSSAWRAASSRSAVAVSLGLRRKPGEVGRVGVLGVDLLGDVRVARPQQRRMARRNERRHRGPPGPAPQHGDLHGRTLIRAPGTARTRRYCPDDGDRLQPAARARGAARPRPGVRRRRRPPRRAAHRRRAPARHRQGRLLPRAARPAGGGPRGRPVAAAHAAGVGRHGTRPRRPGDGPGRGGPHLPRAVGAQLPGARRGQHAHAVALRHRRAEGALPPPAVRRHGVVVLRDDRAGGRRFRPDADPHARRARRRRVGDQRPQVVHLQRPSGQLRHPHRPHRGEPGDRPGGEHGVHRRPARRRLDRGPPDRDDARQHRSLGDPHRRTCGCTTRNASAAGERVIDSASTASARRASPTACAGSPRPRSPST